MIFFVKVIILLLFIIVNWLIFELICFICFIVLIILFVFGLFLVCNIVVFLLILCVVLFKLWYLYINGIVNWFFFKWYFLFVGVNIFDLLI